MLNAKGKIVLYRFRCPDGKEHPMEMIQPSGFTCVTNAWYLNRYMHRIYVNLDELVEVSKLPEEEGRPEVITVEAL